MHTLTHANAHQAANYAAHARGIRGFEKANDIVRGQRGSWRSFSGAFGMVYNKALVGLPATVALEAGMTSVCFVNEWIL